jgi:hypothetical protein
MNIQTVAENLRKTIAGKEAYLARENENRKSEDAHVRMMAYAVVKMLEVNIDELKRILQDVEQCIPKSECSLDGPMIKMFRED